MQSIAIYGAGGFGKETLFLLNTINRIREQYRFAGFLDDDPKPGTSIAKPNSYQSLALAVAKPSERRKLFQKCGSTYDYPNLVDPNVTVDETNRLGKGNIICAGAKLTVDVRLGDFVIVNLNCTVGHDVTIGSYSSLMPSVNLSGNVSIGEGVFIGTGATILQGLTIGDGAVIGAGAVVTKDVPCSVVAVGVPAKWLNAR